MYVHHWQDLLQQEHEAAVSQLRDQRKLWSRQRLESSGISLLGVFAEPDSELFGEKMIRIYKPPQSPSADKSRNLRDLYTRGDVLLMTPEGGGGGGSFGGGRGGFQQTRQQKLAAQKANSAAPREICVADVGTDWLTASVGPTWPAGLWESRKHLGLYPVRMDRCVPKSTLLAQRKALDLVRREKAGTAARLLVDTFAHENNQKNNNSNSQMLSSNGLASIVPARLEEYNSQSLEDAIAKALDEAKQSTSFQPNSSQEQAIKWALGRSLSLIIGPAGTGKTKCAALLIAAAINLPSADVDTSSTTSSSRTTPPPRVLAVAHSNGAADVLLKALLDMDIPAVRVGRPASVSVDVRHRTIVAMADTHPEVKRLRRKAMDPALEDYERGAAAFEVGRSIAEVRRMISTTSPVVVASCIGAHQLLMEYDKDSSASFPIVVLDEAAQSTEPALMCALAAAKAEQVIFVGDTRQLPPTVASDLVALRDSLGVSPMARLESAGVAQETLRVQYRMGPALLEFPSRYFYNGLVTCPPESLLSSMATAKPPAGFPWPKSEPIAFVHLGSNLETTHDLGGKSNPTEAELVVKIVLGLLSEKEIEARGIAIISPYAKQVQLIRSLLFSRNVNDVRVGTVDSFQGQETDLVVFSAVRSNPLHEIGFLRDPRRLCVALTRARRGLIVVGDRNVLQTSRHWSALLESCGDRGCILERKDLDTKDSATTNIIDINEADKGPVEEDTSDAALMANLMESLGLDDDLIF